MKKIVINMEKEDKYITIYDRSKMNKAEKWFISDLLEWLMISEEDVTYKERKEAIRQ